MFDIGWSEMAVILLVALVVIGPRDLPRVARSVGKWVAKGRGMAREFQTAIEDMAREAELDKVKTEIEKAGRTNLGKSIENAIDPTGELGQAFDPTAKSKPRDGAGAKPGAQPAKAAAARPEPAASAAAKPADPAPADAGPTNGKAAAAGVERPAAGNGSANQASERETAPADPS